MRPKGGAHGGAWRETGAVELVEGVNVDEVQLAELCAKHGIRRLSVYGSMARGDQHAGSDVDLLVEFDPGRVPGLLGVADIELQLEAMLGREVDLRTPADLSPYFRDTAAGESRPLYDAA